MRIFLLLFQAFSEFQRDAALRLGAALAFYAVFALAPLLVVLSIVMSLVLGDRMGDAHVQGWLLSALGSEAAALVTSVVAQAAQPVASVGASLLSVGVLLAGATGLFVQLRGALNVIFGADGSRGGLLHALIDRCVAFGVVFLFCAVLVGSLVLGAGILMIESYLPSWFPQQIPLVKILDIAVSIAGITVLLAVLFKTLPARRPAWRLAWGGGLLGALLFTAGKSVFLMYLGWRGFLSIYGAAASLVVLLLWIYFNAQIVLFAAEFVKVSGQSK